MSKLEVNAIEPQTGTTITIGASGDTVNLVGTLQNNGAAIPGDISSVVAGTGLSGGGTTGAVTINIEAAQPTITSLGTITSFRSTGIDDNADALAMTIDSSENVGIKNTTMASFSNLPATDLVVGSGSTHSGITIYSSASTASSIGFADGTSGDARNQGIIQYHHNGDYMRFFTNASERMRITSTGLGIGTSSPGTVPLNVVTTDAGNVDEILELRNNSTDAGTGSRIRLVNSTDAGSTANSVSISSYRNAGTNHDLLFESSNAEKMRITSGGFVGIGTTSPGSPLTVSTGNNGTIAFLNNNVSATTSVSNTLLIQSNCSGSAGVGFGMSIGFNGERNDGNNQRYGTLTWQANTNSGTALKTDFVVTSYSGHEVLRLKQTSVGSQNEMIAPDLLTTGSTSNRYPLYWVHNGTVGSIQPYTGSVREMKTDINDMSSVDWIHSLKPRSFKFRDFETNEDGSKVYLETTNDLPNTEYGLIAEEVNQVNGSDYILDKQIDEDGTENLKGVLYHNLVPVLLKAVQEQKNTIQELEARITTLENA